MGEEFENDLKKFARMNEIGFNHIDLQKG